MPTRALIIKIAMLAGDERSHPMVRQVAFDKLAGFKESHPHLFVLPAEAPELEDGQPMWADVPDAPDANSATPPPPPPRYAKGNPSIVVEAKGVERRVVLLRYKRAPTQWGFLAHQHPYRGDDVLRATLPNRNRRA